jgi:dTDP-glucose 4,6-dehydratase
MKIILTGASGLVGSHALKHLLKTTDSEIVCLCSWEHKGNPDNVPKDERVKVITHDLNSQIPDTMLHHFEGADYILNIASDSHVDRSITDPVPFVRNNVNVALTMLELARKVKPKMFLQFSTDEVYGSVPENYTSKEWDAIVPSNPYAASKAAQEAIAISYWRTYGVPVIITNTMNVFSETQDWEKFIPLCVNRTLKGEEIKIHAYPDKKKAGTRFYIHADSVAEALSFIMSNVPAKLYPDTDRPERINIVGNEEVDNLSLALRIGKILDKEVKYELVDFHSARSGHDLRYALDGSKLEELGWKPTGDFDEMLTSTVLKLKDKWSK